jgi:hypothetical protein
MTQKGFILEEVNIQINEKTYKNSNKRKIKKALLD